MNGISNHGIGQIDWSRTVANKPGPAAPASEPAIDPWGSDRVDLSSAVNGAMNNQWRDVFEVRGPRGSRLECSQGKPIVRPDETVFSTGQSVGPAGSPICR